jgi:hypothetical protein
MSDDELQKAIETDSLWENLVQLTDNLDDYSIFHQVIKILMAMVILNTHHKDTMHLTQKTYRSLDNGLHNS